MQRSLVCAKFFYFDIDFVFVIEKKSKCLNIVLFNEKMNWIMKHAHVLCHMSFHSFLFIVNGQTIKITIGRITLIGFIGIEMTTFKEIFNNRQMTMKTRQTKSI